MATTFQERLDHEVEEKLRPLDKRIRSGKEIEIDEIFGREVGDALDHSTIFLEGADVTKIVTSIPFYETVLVSICHRCAPVVDIKPAIPLLQSGPVIPVLINDYA